MKGKRRKKGGKEEGERPLHSLWFNNLTRSWYCGGGRRGGRRKKGKRKKKPKLRRLSGGEKRGEEKKEGGGEREGAPRIE